MGSRGPSGGGSEAQDFRLQEQKRMQGVGVSPVQKAFARNITAAQQLEQRMGSITKIPGTAGMALNVAGQASLRNQANILRSQSTTAVPVTNESGQVMGVQSKGLFGGTVYSGRGDFKPSQTILASETESAPVVSRPDITPEVTPEVTPEIVPDDNLGLSRRYSSRRFGGGGLTKEVGILLSQGTARKTV